jgi:hypothetical protein
MRPNLERIPSYNDARAEAIVRCAHDGVTGELTNKLDRRDVLALGRHGARQPRSALRTRSPEILRAALLATAVAEVRDESDPRPDDRPRDLPGGRPAARPAPSALFDDVPARLPDRPVVLFREFGARQGITPSAFGWQLVQTVNGPDLRLA